MKVQGQGSAFRGPYQLLKLEGGSPKERASFIQAKLGGLWRSRDKIDWSVWVVANGVLVQRPKNGFFDTPKPVQLRQPAMLLHVSAKSNSGWSPLKLATGGLAKLAVGNRRMCVPLKADTFVYARAFISSLVDRMQKAVPTLVDAQTLAKLIDYDFYSR